MVTSHCTEGWIKGQRGRREGRRRRERDSYKREYAQK
jgi:hypothetical protein